MHKRAYFFCALLLAASLVAACGGGGNEGGVPPEPGGASAGGGGFDMSKATGMVMGKISFDGMPPAPEKIQMSADPYCQQHNKDGVTETVKVSDGGLENVIVYVSSGAPAGPYATPTQAVEIDQQDCHYVPHVFTIMTNQPLRIKNGDMTLHNIHVWAEKNPQYNQGQPVQGMVNETKFANPEIAVPIRCDVHKWMNSFVGVFDHPFHTVSKEGGKFELKVPPGNYEITAWHEKYGKKTMMVEVKDNEHKDANFTFSANDKAAD
jgi:hypothetical protein